MASTATLAPPAARPRSRAQKRGYGSATACAPLPTREIVPLPENGDWLDVCCAHARWHLKHPERERLPRTDLIAAAIVSRTYLRGLARFPGSGRQPSAVIRTSLQQLIVGLGRIWGWDTTDYPPRLAQRDRDVVDRHAKGLRRRLQPLLEGGLLEHRVLQDLELEDRGTELLLLPLPHWTPQERAIGRALHDQLTAALQRPESRATALMAQLDAHQAGGAERGRNRAQKAQRASALAAFPRPTGDDLEIPLEMAVLEDQKTLSAHPAPRAVPFSSEHSAIEFDESSRGEEKQQPMTRDDAWLQPIVGAALSGLSRQPLGEDRGSVPVVASGPSSVLYRSSRKVEAWSGDPQAVPGARELAEAWHLAVHGRNAVLEPMMLVGRTARAGLVALAERAQAEADRGAHLHPLGELFLSRAGRYPHPHAALRSLESEIRRARALRELQQPVATQTARRRAWDRHQKHAPTWLYTDPVDGAPMVIDDDHGRTRLAVRRPLTMDDLLDRRVQSVLEAAMLIADGRHHAQIELETPDGVLAGRFATRRGRHSLLADGARIYVPGHEPIFSW